jgi:hypothetical protein
MEIYFSFGTSTRVDVVATRVVVRVTVGAGEVDLFSKAAILLRNVPPLGVSILFCRKI